MKYICMCAQLCPTLCNTMECSLSVFSVHGVFQAEYWSRLPFPPLGELTDPGIEPVSLASPASGK